MPRLRSNEWNFAANAAALITELLKGEGFAESELGHAEPELSELRGARRLDLVIFSRSDPTEPLVTGELKVPWDPLGRTPYNTHVVEDAYRKAGNAGSLYFITWNIRRIVVWKTDEPGVQLINRVIYDQEIISREIDNQEALSRPEFLAELKAGVEALLRFLTSVFTGLFEPRFLPIDRIFIARLEAALDHPISATTSTLVGRSTSDRAFRQQFESWMRDIQGWLVTPAAEMENITRASRFTCYVLVNRLCFYNALRRKYDELPRLTAANNIVTGAMLERRLQRAFNDARRFTGDYESVFDGDFGDTLPFLTDDAVPDWREMVRLLDNYDFAHIDVDVIGAMYERLITPSERHRYGQHYTQPRVVDLMTALSIETGRDRILDPGCGGGTFLVGAYKRKSQLSPEMDHSELLASLYGCDILQYACHLTTINLAIRDLIDDDNFPRVHRGDFLAYQPGEIFSSQPVRMQAGGLTTGTESSRLEESSIDVVIGNPPYISARGLPAEAKARYLAEARHNWPIFDWKPSSDIYLYFWLQSARFLRDGGRLALLTQSGWLDGDFGIPLQEWMLSHFNIEAIIESEAEPWFTDARVATCITVLRKVTTPDNDHRVSFVRLNGTLQTVFAQASIPTAEALAQSITRGEGLPGLVTVRALPQGQLERDGRTENGSYVGSRWGRHLRTPDSLYDLYAGYTASFIPLSGLAVIRRGITTNCDAFFLVDDISREVLGQARSAHEFRESYGISRERVQTGELKLIRRQDGVEFALPANCLRPILKTPRDFRSYTTSLAESSLAVCFQGERRHLAHLAERYVAAGERERWHLSPSFAQNRNAWYILRTPEVNPILFPKTIQYVPIVLLNDGVLLANQRLYEIRPKDGVDELAVWAVLNSTLFAFERYTAAKSLGREAAIDIEVFTAEALRVPDLRLLSNEYIERLHEAAEELKSEEPSPVIDDVLMQMGQSEALDYINRTHVAREIWPRFMESKAREAIDIMLLQSLGLKENAAREIRERICNEFLEYTRNLKILEFQAQDNRRKVPDSKSSPREVAVQVLQQIISDRQLTLRKIPQDFIPADAEHRMFLIPATGKLTMSGIDLFTGVLRGKIHGHDLEFRNEGQAELVGLLSRYGLSGTFDLPTEQDQCRETILSIQSYLSSIGGEFDAAVAEVSSDVEFQTRVLKEGMNVVLHRG